MKTRICLFVTAILAPLAACGLTEGVPKVDLQGGESQAGTQGADSGTTEAGADARAGLPCNVSALLAAKCTSCHSAKHQGTPMALLTYDDLVAPAATDPTKKVYELALERMNDSNEPMPPGAPLDADTIAVFASWAKAGAPATVCGAADADAAVPPRADAGLPECVLNSDCPGELVCRNGSCDVECITDKDCTATWSCIETRCHPPTTATTEPDAG